MCKTLAMFGLLVCPLLASAADGATSSAYRDDVLTSNVNGPVLGGAVIGTGNHCAGAGTVTATRP